MDTIGAGVRYEVGNKSEVVRFTEFHPVASLKDNTVVAEFRGLSETIVPGKEYICPKQFIEWAQKDPMSPFRDGSLFVSWDDKKIDVNAEKAAWEAKAVKVKQGAAIPDGLPENGWKPKQLMDLYRALEPKTIPESQFLVTTPPGKARCLREYMVKNHITVKDGKIIKEASAA